MKSKALAQWIDRLLDERPVRANSLIITVYGDMISAHGGTVWLGSFINLVAPLGLNPRMVRTSVFRLSREKWLISEQIGRRSFYSLTGIGRRRFEHAHRRIYHAAQLPWDGDWQLVIFPGDTLPAAQREGLRKELQWEGFAVIAPGVMAHPTADSSTMLDILQDNGCHDKVVVMQAHTLGALRGKPLKEMANTCWNLAAVAEEYQSFITRFGLVMRTLKGAADLDPEQCFVLRTLLMHEFRRVQLRDPQLPEPLLPNDWPGAVARTMCGEIYRLCQEKSEQHLQQVLETADGALPPASEEFYSRFGGLPLAAPAG